MDDLKYELSYSCVNCVPADNRSALCVKIICVYLMSNVSTEIIFVAVIFVLILSLLYWHVNKNNLFSFIIDTIKSNYHLGF